MMMVTTTKMLGNLGLYLCIVLSVNVPGISSQTIYLPQTVYAVSEGSFANVSICHRSSVEDTSLEVSTGNVTAFSGTDFLGVSQTVTIPAGTMCISQFISIYPDSVPNESEFFLLRVGAPQPQTVTITITDERAVGTADQTEPVVTCIDNVTQLTTVGSGGARVQFTEPTATDNSGLVAVLSASHRPGQYFITGSTLVTYIFIDPSGNKGSCRFQVIITEDSSNTDPVITSCPSLDNITVTSMGPTHKQLQFTAPTCSDEEDGALLVSCIPSSGFTVINEITSVTCTCTDTQQQRDSCSVSLSARMELCPQTQQISIGNPLIFAPPSCFDNSDNFVEASTCTPPSESSPSTSTIVTCQCRLQPALQCTFFVMVSQARIDLCPPTQEISSGDLVVFSHPSCYDSSGNMYSSTCNPSSGTFFQSTTVTCTCSGQPSLQCTFDVTVSQDSGTTSVPRSSTTTTPTPAPGPNCETNGHECGESATCEDIPNGINCTCKDGFYFDFFIPPAISNCTACGSTMYGFNCAEECTCVQDADCDSFDGTCTGSSCGVGTVYTCDRNDLDVTITPSRQEVDENVQFTVTCIVNLGQSDVTVNWTSPSGMEIDSNNIKYSLISAENAHYLTVKSAAGDDSGNYSCTAFLKQPTQAVTEKTAIVDIFVRVPGKIAPDFEVVRKEVVGESMVTLRCEAFGTVFTQIEWLFQNQSVQLVSNVHQGVQTGNPFPNKYSRQLVISNLNVLNNGTYACKVKTNGVMTDFKEVDLFVVDFPEIVNLTQTSETSSSLTFMWDISDTGNDILKCRANYSDNEMSVGSQPCDFDTECEIEELSPYTNYSVTIECRNKAGYSTPLAGGGRTLAAAPLAPGNVQVAETTENCEVTWTASESANGPQLFYQVMQSVKQRNEGESGASVVVEVTEETSYSTEKETLLKNSEYMFSVCANNSEFKSACTFAEGSCITNTAAPEEIPPFVAPDAEKDVSNSSVTLTLTEVNTRNGPISCYEFVVFKRTQDHSGGGSPDEEVPFDQVKTAPEDDLPYRSVVLTHEEYSKMEPVTIGLDGAVTRCTLSGNNRRKRRSNMVDGNQDLVATNSPLSSDTQYDIFMRTYTPTDDGRFQYASSDYVNVMTLKGEEKGGGGGAPGGLIAFLILLILAVIIAGAVFIVWRKRNMTDKPDTENLPMEINNINGGGADGHLDGKNRAFEEDEMIAEVPPINIDQLGERILEKHKHNDKLFFAEFRSLMSTNPEATIEAFNNVSNKEKNRYINIPCYDHSRVKLNKIEDDENSDYINANYVDGYSVPEKFIAAQGPKEETVEDFWRMIWEQNTKTIIMLTKCFESGRDKCFQYWPDGGEVSYGKFTVCLDSTLECPDYVIRQLRISMNKEDDDEEGADEETEKRIVTQFHFLAWPDHGVPEYPYTMLAFIKRIRQMTQNKPEKGQIVIHCSAGVGRTGTYITIDAMLDRLKEQKTVDIFNYIQKIRLQRSTLVQSQVQYVFIYHALHEEHLYGHTEVKLNDLKQYFRRLKLKTLQDDNSPLHLEFKTAATLPVKDTGTKEASKPGNKEKNRIRNYLPYDKNRVSLERLVGDEDSTYINASYINGYERRNMYIITQAPMENTASDFWRMVWDSLTSTVVMLTDLEEKGNEMCVKFWPEEEPKTFGNLTIELADQEEEESFTIKDFTLSNNQGVSGRKVRMYQFHGWPEIGVPDCDAVTYLATVSHEYQKAAEEQESADQSKHPIIVFCHTGVGRTAIWCALSILLERAKAEGVVDVFQTVRTLRQQRQHMVQDTTQYEFLYQAVLSHLGKLDDMYENLQS